MGARLCPVCGCPVRSGACPRCGAGGKARSKRTAEQERARKGANPWRGEYKTAEYKRACQRALDRTGGRCAVSGAVIADRRGGKWVMRRNGGIHHIVPLSQGGTNDAANLVPLEVSVHNRVDAELRRKRREQG